MVAEPAEPRALSARADRPPETILVGLGLGEWRLGMRRRIASGLLRTVHYPRNDGSGCVGPTPRATAFYVDYYPGLRLAWVGSRERSYFLNAVATSRRGDESYEAFVIGKSSFASIRRLHPQGPGLIAVNGLRCSGARTDLAASCSTST
jgi:hypothetical protein